MANNNPLNVYPDPDGNNSTTQPVEEPVPNSANSPGSYETVMNDAAPSASSAGSD